MKMVTGLVSPYINSLLNKVELFAIHAPMRELRVKQTVAKNVAPELFDARTSNAVVTSRFSVCQEKKIINRS